MSYQLSYYLVQATKFVSKKSDQRQDLTPKEVFDLIDSYFSKFEAQKTSQKLESITDYYQNKKIAFIIGPIEVDHFKKTWIRVVYNLGHSYIPLARSIAEEFDTNVWMVQANSDSTNYKGQGIPIGKTKAKPIRSYSELTTIGFNTPYNMKNFDEMKKSMKREKDKFLFLAFENMKDFETLSK